MESSASTVIIIGAGTGGLATAIRLAAAGVRVQVVEATDAPGGKMRTVDSAAGPVDAGPTVLTMRGRFDDLFALAGERLEDHVGLVREPLLARHWWPDGSRLDLFDDVERSAEAVSGFAGAREAEAFRAFSADAHALFEAFEGPVMDAARPSLVGLTQKTLARPGLIPKMAPMRSLAGALAGRFRDPRLRQLFGRYATYVGGMPRFSPGVLQLIWHAEASGVWRVEGGMHRLAEALAALAERLGAELRYGTPVERIEVQGGRATGVVLTDGARIAADAVVFNGDPRALVTGRLGTGVLDAVPASGVTPRSLSARVWAFAAEAAGPELVHHNVFFGGDPEAEFGPIREGRAPEDPTLYICAEDRGTGMTPPALERFEIIENAAPSEVLEDREKAICRTRVFERLARFGLTFTPRPDVDALTVPAEFDAIFPASLGSLYGRSPHGMMATFQRPGAVSRVPGLFLAGGGTHPGAGIAMAALSGRHAAEATLRALASTSTSRRTAMRGGMSTASRIAGNMPSRSSPS